MRHVRYLRSRGLRIVEGRWHISYIALVFRSQAGRHPEGRAGSFCSTRKRIFPFIQPLRSRVCKRRRFHTRGDTKARSCKVSPNTSGTAILTIGGNSGGQETQSQAEARSAAGATGQPAARRGAQRDAPEGARGRKEGSPYGRYGSARGFKARRRGPIVLLTLPFEVGWS